MTLLFGMPGGAEWIFIFIAIGIIGIITLIPQIFYLITLQSTLKAIAVENRKMPSGNVWLLLIPLFAIVWHFIVVDKMAESISAEAISKNIEIDEMRPGYNIGLPMCILNCFFIIPGINVLTGIAFIICWILYWVKIAAFKNQILNTPALITAL